MPIRKVEQDVKQPLLQRFQEPGYVFKFAEGDLWIIIESSILSGFRGDTGYGVLRKHKNPPDQVDDSGPPQASHARLARHLGSNKTNNLNSFNVESSMFTESKNVL